MKCFERVKKRKGEKCLDAWGEEGGMIRKWS
jgi:hypothetical protein